MLPNITSNPRKDISPRQVLLTQGDYNFNFFAIETSTYLDRVIVQVFDSVLDPLT